MHKLLFFGLTGMSILRGASTIAAWETTPSRDMTNSQIADAFDEIAEILDFLGENPFRVRAYRNSSRVIRDHATPIASLVEEHGEKQLIEIKGIGKDLAAKIVMLVQTGELPMLKELQAKVPSSVLLLMRIPGMGPKKAAQLHKELGIKTLDELKAACDDGRVSKLKGFGKKTEEMILKNMAVAEQASVRLLWYKADEVVQSLREHLQQ